MLGGKLPLKKKIHKPHYYSVSVDLLPLVCLPWTTIARMKRVKKAIADYEHGGFSLKRVSMEAVSNKT